MKTFDFFSDIHLETWIPVETNHIKKMKYLEEFVTNLIPALTSNTLVIAGDLGEYNSLNKEFLILMKKHYKNILIVFGNHDYYMSKSKLYKYKGSSYGRIEEMKNWVNTQEGIYVLDGNIVTIDGIRFGGCTMWYDFSYGINVLNEKEERIYKLWREEFYDSKYIFNIGGITAFFEKQKQLMHSIVQHIDVIVSHVSPDWSTISEQNKGDLFSSFYYFDMEEFRPYTKGKIWCYGHVHEKRDDVNEECRFINHSLGYRSEVIELIDPIKTIYM